MKKRNRMDVSVTIGIGILFKIWRSTSVQDWRKNRLRLGEIASKLPGPRGLPLIGNALIFTCKPEEILFRILEMSKPYDGPFHWWLGPKLVIGIKNPEDIESILLSASATHKDASYRFAEKFFGRGLVTSSGPTMKKHRKVIVSMLNKKTLNSFVKYFDKHTQRCVERLEAHVGTEEFDVHSYMESCAVDSALDTVLATPGITQRDGYQELMSHINRMYKLVIDRMFKIWFQSDWIYACTNYQKLQDRSMYVIRQFVSNIVALKKEEYHTSQPTSGVLGSPESMVLEQLIARNEQTGLMDDDRLRESSESNSLLENSPESMVLEQLIAHNEQTGLMDDDRLGEEMLTLFIAAEDSSTTVSSFVLLMLGIYPAIQEKVRTELFEVLGEESVTGANISKLKYLSMVIKETLRLYPLAPVLIRKLTGDVHLQSCKLPEGCIIAMMPFLTHRDPKYWSDPDTFNPDRFTPENSVGRHSYCYIPFSGGARACVGQEYAMLYVKTLVSNVLKKYRVSSNTSINELKLKADLVLRSVNGYKISITRL